LLGGRYEDSPKPGRSGVETRNHRDRAREEQRIMIQNLLILAQEESVGSDVFNMRNGILLLVVIVLLVVYKIYKNRQMND
jgi:hypothetical protein